LVKRRGKVVKRAQGKNLRTLTLKRTSRKAYSVRIQLTTSSKGKRISVIRRISAC
jgi:hypothetical protein